MDKIFNIPNDELKRAGGYNTAEEICSEPRLWMETLQIIKDNKSKIAKYLDARLANEKTRIILTGAGTSAYVGDTVAPYLARILGRRVEAIPTTDIVSCPEDYLVKDTPTILISFARSGDSPESVGAYDLAEKIIGDLGQVVITCNKEGNLAKRAQGNTNNLTILMPEESNDRGFAMTSSFSCMLLTALLIFDLRNLEKYDAIIKSLSENGERIIGSEAEELLKFVKLGYTRVVYLGSSSLSGLSKEAALKSLELTSGKIKTSSESVLGFRHGPKSLINDSTIVFMFLSNNEYTRKYDFDLLREMYNDGGEKKIIAISSFKDEEVEKIVDKLFVVNNNVQDRLEDSLMALDYILYAQIFAVLYSLELDITPDNPRPDGTVNRVVRGVTIHEYTK